MTDRKLAALALCVALAMAVVSGTATYGTLTDSEEVPVRVAGNVPAEDAPDETETSGTDPDDTTDSTDAPGPTTATDSANASDSTATAEPSDRTEAAVSVLDPSHPNVRAGDRTRRPPTAVRP